MIAFTGNGGDGETWLIRKQSLHQVNQQALSYNNHVNSGFSPFLILHGYISVTNMNG
jgi:hypothetical protein